MSTLYTAWNTKAGSIRTLSYLRRELPEKLKNSLVTLRVKKLVCIFTEDATHEVLCMAQGRVQKDVAEAKSDASKSKGVYFLAESEL